MNERPSFGGIRRPLHVLTGVAALVHHAFELGAGVGLVFQPYVGLWGASALWGTVMPAWVVAATRGGRRFDAPLAFAAGMSVAGAALHFTLWPLRVRRGIPLLLSAEGLRPRHLPAYNAILYAWALAAATALARETPASARRWALVGAATVLPLRRSARQHFRWVSEQARLNPAWWNRALASS